MSNAASFPMPTVGRPRGVWVIERLERLRADPHACWLWDGRLTEDGYGRGPQDGRYVSAHRTAYELWIGPIPDGMQIDHVCHNRDLNCLDGSACLHRRCVNPAHLEPVPPQENKDRAREGRRECPHGDTEIAFVDGRHRRCQACHRASQRRYRERKAASRNADAQKPKAKKLTDAQVAEIRSRSAAGSRNAALAREYAVSPGHISEIVRGLKRVLTPEQLSVIHKAKVDAAAAVKRSYPATRGGAL